MHTSKKCHLCTYTQAKNVIAHTTKSEQKAKSRKQKNRKKKKAESKKQKVKKQKEKSKKQKEIGRAHV